jgi:hypothetical protein
MLLFPIASWAFDPVYMQNSAVKTADALIYTGAGYFYGVLCQTDGTNSVTFAIDDSTAGSGSKLHADVICTTSPTNRSCVFGFDPPIPFKTGLYVNITSSDATPDYTVFYRGR